MAMGILSFMGFGTPGGVITFKGPLLPLQTAKRTFAEIHQIIIEEAGPDVVALFNPGRSNAIQLREKTTTKQRGLDMQEQIFFLGYYKEIGLKFNVMKKPINRLREGIRVKGSPTNARQTDAIALITAGRSLLAYQDYARDNLVLTFVPMVEIFLVNYFFPGYIGNLLFAVCLGTIVWALYKSASGGKWSFKALAILGKHVASEAEVEEAEKRPREIRSG